MHTLWLLRLKASLLLNADVNTFQASYYKKMTDFKWNPKVIIDTVSDLPCPWCYVGYKKLVKAMKTHEQQLDFVINRSPYRIDKQTATKGE